MSRCWSTCPCAEAGFLYGVFFYQKSWVTSEEPSLGGLTFTYLALGGHPPFLRVRRGSDPPEPFRRVLPLLGLCFLGFTMALISLLFGFRFVPLLPFSLPLVNDGKRTEGWVVRNIELSKPKATLATVEEH